MMLNMNPVLLGQLLEKLKKEGYTGSIDVFSRAGDRIGSLSLRDGKTTGFQMISGSGNINVYEGESLLPALKYAVRNGAGFDVYDSAGMSSDASGPLPAEDQATAPPEPPPAVPGPGSLLAPEPELVAVPEPELLSIPEPEPGRVFEPESAIVLEPQISAVPETEIPAVDGPEPPSVIEPEPSAGPVLEAVPEPAPSSPTQVPDEEFPCEGPGTGQLICEDKPAEEQVKIEEEAVPKEEDVPYIIEDEESIKNRAQLIEDLEKVLRRLESLTDHIGREGDFQHLFRQNCIERSEDHRFLHPSAGKFEYGSGEITVCDTVGSCNFAIGMAACCNAVLERLNSDILKGAALPPGLKAEIESAFKRYRDIIKDAGLASIVPVSMK